MKILKKIINKLILKKNYANIKTLAKGITNDDRFKDIISDPLNILINRSNKSGYIQNKNIILHNGIKVAVNGKYSYYGNFSKILIYNRGVHEPLEEYCFQELLKKIKSQNIKMIELGAYWGHYSMWLKKIFPDSEVYLVEPDVKNLQVGKYNFRNNNLSGEFINDFVSKNNFTIDKFLKTRKIKKVDILHSDIQGFELDMLENSFESLNKERIKYLFISTHSRKLHEACLKFIKKFNYRIEISSDVDYHTTSYDGFIFASSLKLKAVFANFKPMGRMDILNSSSYELVKYLNHTLKN